MTASIMMQQVALIIIFALQPGYAMDCIFLTLLHGHVQLHQLAYLGFMMHWLGRYQYGRALPSFSVTSPGGGMICLLAVSGALAQTVAVWQLAL